MSTVNDAARNLIDEACAARFDWERDSLLNSALAELGDQGGERDDVEARGIILALRAQTDPAYLPDAERILSEVRQRGEETNWISLHLVDAYYIARDYENVIRHARDVDQSFFDDQELRWRSLKVTEILAASLLALGELDEGLRLARYVCGQIATAGELERTFLASPSELAHRAVAMVNDEASDRVHDAGCVIIQELLRTVEVKVWFPNSLADAIITADENCSLPDHER